MESYLITLGAGAILAAWAFRQFRREQRRGRTLARLMAAIKADGHV